MEQFVSRVFKDGKITIPKRLRELFLIKDGCYVRLALVEVLEREAEGVKRREIR